MKGILMDSATNRSDSREANVLLELCMTDAMSEEVLDANSDDVLDAVQKHGAHIALGPAIALNLQDCSIRLRFDAVVATDADAYRLLAELIDIIEQHTDLQIVRTRSAIESGQLAELAPC